MRKPISIHKALAGLDGNWARYRPLRSISIHKALAGLDLTLFQPREAAKVISIHKALAGLDIMASPVL